MKETARIISVNGREARLSCVSSEGCKSCSGNSFCSVKGREFDAMNSSNLEIESGDKVEIYLPPARTIFAGFMVLIFPLIGFLLFYLTGSLIPGAGEGLSFLLGIAGLFAGFGITWVYNRKSSAKNTPVITRLIEKNSSTEH